MDLVNTSLENQIMQQSRHQFIYGYNGETREKFLREMASRYPANLNDSNNIAVYVDSIGLPKIGPDSELDKTTLRAFSREYLISSILESLIDKTVKETDKSDLAKRSENLLQRINKLWSNGIEIESIEELRTVLEETRRIYYQKYEEYVKSGIVSNFIDILPVSFINLNMFIREYKYMLNSKSFIGVIIDHQTPIATESEQGVNSLVASRINADISMKVACEPGTWGHYYDLNGNYIEYVHDYGTVDLDDSNTAYMKKLKTKYSNFAD